MRQQLAANIKTGAALTAALMLSACSVFQSAPIVAPPAPKPAPPPVEEPPPLTAKMAAVQNDLTRMVAIQDRLYHVAAPLLIDNADLCKAQARNLLGFTAKNKYSYPGDFSEAAQAVLGYGERLQVSGVLPGSGAAHAGLRKGDALIAVEGKPLPTGPNAETSAAAIFGTLAGDHALLAMSVSRGGVVEGLKVPFTRACGFKVDLGNSDNINSYADGTRVMITRGMVNFAQSDEAIAFVLATDMVHNMLGHAGTMRMTNTIGSMIDNLVAVRPDLSMLIGSAGVKPTPADLDVAADHIALYMLARAGYNVDHAHAFWQRLSTQYPASVLNGYTAMHPNVVARLAGIDHTVAEIKAKQAGKKPLLP